jgi:Flp pilus assembly protein TadB
MDRDSSRRSNAEPSRRLPKRSVPQITTARMSRAEELHRREKRYIMMMSFRGVCLILATVLVTAHAPLLWLWIPILVLGIVVVPWLAVIIANDRGRKDRHEYHPKAPSGRDRHELTAAGEPVPTPRVIDADPE